MSTIPLIASAADLPSAIQYAERFPRSRWFVHRKAHQFGQGDLVPESWAMTAAAQDLQDLLEQPLEAVVAGIGDEVRHAISTVWNAALHPRDKNGQFIEKDGVVTFPNPNDPFGQRLRGTAVGTSEGGSVTVHTPQGLYAVDPAKITVAPKAKATLTPEGASRDLEIAHELDKIEARRRSLEQSLQNPRLTKRARHDIRLKGQGLEQKRRALQEERDALQAPAAPEPEAPGAPTEQANDHLRGNSYPEIEISPDLVDKHVRVTGVDTNGNDYTVEGRYKEMPDGTHEFLEDGADTEYPLSGARNIEQIPEPTDENQPSLFDGDGDPATVALDEARKTALTGDEHPVDIGHGYTMNPHLYTDDNDNEQVEWELRSPDGDLIATNDGTGAGDQDGAALADWADTAVHDYQVAHQGGDVDNLPEGHEAIYDSGGVVQTPNGPLHVRHLDSGDVEMYAGDRSIGTARDMGDRWVVDEPYGSFDTWDDAARATAKKRYGTDTPEPESTPSADTSHLGTFEQDMLEGARSVAAVNGADRDADPGKGLPDSPPDLTALSDEELANRLQMAEQFAGTPGGRFFSEALAESTRIDAEMKRRRGVGTDLPLPDEGYDPTKRYGFTKPISKITDKQLESAFETDRLPKASSLNYRETLRRAERRRAIDNERRRRFHDPSARVPDADTPSAPQEGTPEAPAAPKGPSTKEERLARYGAVGDAMKDAGWEPKFIGSHVTYTSPDGKHRAIKSTNGDTIRVDEIGGRKNVATFPPGDGDAFRIWRDNGGADTPPMPTYSEDGNIVQSKYELGVADKRMLARFNEAHPDVKGATLMKDTRTGLWHAQMPDGSSKTFDFGRWVSDRDGMSPRERLRTSGEYKEVADRANDASRTLETSILPSSTDHGRAAADHAAAADLADLLGKSDVAATHRAHAERHVQERDRRKAREQEAEAKFRALREQASTDPTKQPSVLDKDPTTMSEPEMRFQVQGLTKKLRSKLSESDRKRVVDRISDLMDEQNRRISERVPEGGGPQVRGPLPEAARERRTLRGVKAGDQITVYVGGVPYTGVVEGTGANRKLRMPNGRVMLLGGTATKHRWDRDTSQVAEKPLERPVESLSNRELNFQLDGLQQLIRSSRKDADKRRARIADLQAERERREAARRETLNAPGDDATTAPTHGDASRAEQTLTESLRSQGGSYSPAELMRTRQEGLFADLTDPHVRYVTLKPPGGSEINIDKNDAYELAKQLGMRPPAVVPYTPRTGRGSGDAARNSVYSGYSDERLQSAISGLEDMLARIGDDVSGMSPAAKGTRTEYRNDLAALKAERARRGTAPKA